MSLTAGMQKDRKRPCILSPYARQPGRLRDTCRLMDAGIPYPTRRPGQWHFALNVAPQHRRQGIGGALYVQAEAFACRKGARLLYTAYNETNETEDAPAATFLKKRGFELLERFYPSSLDLTKFDPTGFAPALERMRAQNIRLQTYAEIGDNAQNRRNLYELEQLARATQPFREVEPYIPELFETWEQDFHKRDPATIFLAVALPENTWIGVVTGLEWYFTGVHPLWRGRGIATALKVQCLMEAHKRGIAQMETENHEDNAAMLAINRKLGFVFTAPEVACIKRF